MASIGHRTGLFDALRGRLAGGGARDWAPWGGRKGACVFHKGRFPFYSTQCADARHSEQLVRDREVRAGIQFWVLIKPTPLAEQGMHADEMYAPVLHPHP